MKLSQAKHNHIAKPFVDTEVLSITTHKKGNRISGFTFRYKPSGQEQKFEVKNFKIKAAWQKGEKWLGQFK